MSQNNWSSYRDKVILVIGASGCIGNALFKKLHSFKSKVYGTCNGNKHSDLLSCDIADYADIMQLIEKVKPNIVVNLSGYTKKEHTLDSLDAAIKINMLGLLNICMAVSRLECFERLITVGTMDELMFSDDFRGKVSPYAMSKYFASELSLYIIKNFDLPITVVRTGVVYGCVQNNMFISSCISALLNNQEFNMSKGEQSRDFLYVDDFVDAILAIIESRQLVTNFFDIGYGKSHKLLEVALYIAEKLGKKHLLKIGTVPYRENEIMSYEVSNMICRESIGWVPTIDIFSGLDKTIVSFMNENK